MRWLFGDGPIWRGGILNAAGPGGNDPASIEGEDERVYVRTSSDSGAPVDLLSLSAMSIMLDIPPETITGAGINSLILEVPDATV